MFSEKRRSILYLGLTALFCIISFFYIRNLKFDYDFEAFFPNEDSELNFYQKYRNTFEYDNEFVMLAIENKKGIFDSSFLQKINLLTGDLQKTPMIQKVVSPTNLSNLSINDFSVVEKQLLHFDNPSLYKDDSTHIYTTKEHVGAIFPEDGKSVCLFIKTDEHLSKKKSDSLAKSIEKAFTKYKFEEVHFVGRIVAQDVYLKNLNKEFIVFLSLSFLLVIVFLYFSFRSLYGVIVPISIVMLSIYLTLGIMGMMGKPIDIMTVMLPTMIFIAGMSDVVHYFSKFFEELHKGTEKSKIYSLIIKEVGFPTFLTLITTIVGFLSLLFSSIKPIRDFGIYTSVGITIAFILSYTVLPALLYFFTPKKLINIHSENNKTYGRMRQTLFWIFRNQKLILVITAVTLSLSFWGISKIRVNNILLEDLSAKVKIKQDFNYFDSHYSGARPLEIAINLKDTSKHIWDYDVLVEINKIDEYLKTSYGAGFIYSPAVVAKTINKAVNDGEAISFKFPEKEDYNDFKKYILKNKKNKDLKRIVTVDGKTARITGKIQDIGSLKIKELNKKFEAFLTKNVDLNLIQIDQTGAANLLDRNNEYMVDNMIQGFAWSIGIIAILTYFLHRSWRMVLVFLLPNFIPMVIIAGFMGFMGIELKAATSLVFSIAFGVATDDTIHFISRLKIELGYGKSLLYAFKRTYFETGKPIILTTFILVGGFMSLMTSNFQSTFYFGFLICITIVIALVAEMFLLPILLLMILGKRRKKEE